MFNIIQFLKDTYKEVRYKTSYASLSELQHSLFWFFLLLVFWTVFLFGASELGRFLQEVIYDWLKVDNTK